MTSLSNCAVCEYRLEFVSYVWVTAVNISGKEGGKGSEGGCLGRNVFGVGKWGGKGYGGNGVEWGSRSTKIGTGIGREIMGWK